MIVNNVKLVLDDQVVQGSGRRRRWTATAAGCCRG